MAWRGRNRHGRAARRPCAGRRVQRPADARARLRRCPAAPAAVLGRHPRVPGLRRRGTGVLDGRLPGERPFARPQAPRAGDGRRALARRAVRLVDGHLPRQGVPGDHRRDRAEDGPYGRAHRPVARPPHRREARPAPRAGAPRHRQGAGLVIPRRRADRAGRQGRAGVGRPARTRRVLGVVDRQGLARLHRGLGHRLLQRPHRPGPPAPDVERAVVRRERRAHRLPRRPDPRAVRARLRDRRRGPPLLRREPLLPHHRRRRRQGRRGDAHRRQHRRGPLPHARGRPGLGRPHPAVLDLLRPAGLLGGTTSGAGGTPRRRTSSSRPAASRS